VLSSPLIVQSIIVCCRYLLDRDAFWRQTRVGRRNHVRDDGPGPLRNGHFRGSCIPTPLGQRTRGTNHSLLSLFLQISMLPIGFARWAQIRFRRVRKEVSRVEQTGHRLSDKTVEIVKSGEQTGLKTKRFSSVSRPKFRCRPISKPNY